MEMSSQKKSMSMTPLALHYDCDYDVNMNQPITDHLRIVDKDFMHINVYPQPILTRNGPEKRGKFYVPQTDDEWIQMVNRFNNGPQEMYYPAKSVCPIRPVPKPVRSISANSYFDPFTLRRNIPSNAARNEKEMTRIQMMRAYQRACSQSIAGGRNRASSSLDFPFETPQETPALRTRTAPITTRSPKSLISDNTSGYCTGYEANQTTPFPVLKEKQGLVSQQWKSKAASVKLPSKKEAWYSPPYRARIVKQSPPWRSLMNRRPQGMRATGDLCPKHCRCCFEDTYDSHNKNIFKIDPKYNAGVINGTT